MKAAKRLLCILPILFLWNFLHAQLMEEDTARNEPFFKATKFVSRGYVGFEGAAGQYLRKKAAMQLGLSLNWVINHKYVVSAKYHTITTPLDIKNTVAPERTDSVLLKHHFAGLAFGYIVFDNKKVSLQPELAVGWASEKFMEGRTTYRKDFAMIIPAVYGVYNVSPHFRFGLGIHYRQAIANNLEGLKSADLSGVGGVLFLRVGTF